MALYSLRLRRTLTTLQRSLSTIPTTTTTRKICPHSSLLLHQSPLSSAFQSRAFRSSCVTLSQSIQYKHYHKDHQPFEGCDYKHWIITIRFPSGHNLTPEEMVRTYEEICAKGLNITIEEAKKKIYACDTTTYQGFHALMTEEESEKFEDLPLVVFVVPDAYSDPQNKIYGGDKYENGVITPRPPPVQHGRTWGRYPNRNRILDQPRCDQKGSPIPTPQDYPQHDQQGTMQGDGFLLSPLTGAWAILTHGCWFLQGRY